MYKKIIDSGLGRIFVAIIVLFIILENRWNAIAFILISLLVAAVFCQYKVWETKRKIIKLDNEIKDLDIKIDNYKK